MVSKTNTNTNEIKAPVADDIDLDSVLSEIGKQGKVSVSRVEPEWCKGHVRTVPIQGTEPITIEWIGKYFGGSLLTIRVYSGSGVGSLRARRDIEISGPPKDGYGVEVVRGPDGEPVPITRINDVRRRYNLLHGLDDPSDHRPPPPQDPAPKFDLSAVLQTMIQAQNTQNQTMISMLVSRISSLEGLLQNQVQQGQQQAQVNPVQQIDPLGSLKSTVDTIAQLEKIKEAMGISDRDREPETETGIYTTLIKSFMDLELEKRRAQVAQIQARQPQGPPPRALPQPPQPFQPVQAVQPPQHAKQPQPAMAAKPSPEQPIAEGFDPEQIAEAMQRIEKLDRKERLQLAQLVLGEEIDDGDDYEDEDENDTVNIKNDFPDRQGAQNALNSAYNDETSDETAGNESNACSDPSPPRTDTPPYEY